MNWLFIIRLIVAALEAIVSTSTIADTAKRSGIVDHDSKLKDD